MSETEYVTSEAGMPRILWYISTADGPLTVAEMGEEFDVRESSVSAAVRRLFRSGLLVRRQRDVGGRGRNPYEYAVCPRDR